METLFCRKENRQYFMRFRNGLSIYLHLVRLIPDFPIGNFFFAQFRTLKLRKEMLNAANNYLFGIKRTQCKYIDTSFRKVLYIGCLSSIDVIPNNIKSRFFHMYRTFLTMHIDSVRVVLFELWPGWLIKANTVLQK